MFPGAKIDPREHVREPGAPPTPRPLSIGRLSIGLVLSFALFQGLAGCESNKNYEQRNGYAASLPSGEQHAGIFADDPPGCLGLCQRDPGSPLVDCEAAEKGLEFIEVWNFDTGVAPYMYTYTDRSVHNLEPYGWEPEAAPIARCVGVENEVGFHLRGGPFRDWGGGFGMRLDWRLAGLGNCGIDDPAYRSDFCRPLGTEYPYSDYTFDLTEWEGVSFWARRGPDGQPLLRVMIGDQRTDDDISFLMYSSDPDAPRFCERNRVCGCPGDVPCLPVPEEFKTALTARDALRDCSLSDVSVCWDQELDPQMTKYQTYEYCGTSACECPYEAFPEENGGVDLQFVGRSCNSFGFRGGIVNDYCYNPGEDPDPYESNYLCGDHWTKPVHLTTDWQFFKVPFTSMLQQGWAKEQHEFDLNAVSMIRFSWDKGNIDYYLDDVSFYRKKRPIDGAAGADSQ